MRFSMILLIAITLSVLLACKANSVTMSDDNCMKFSFDTLPFFGGSDKEPEGSDSVRGGDSEPREYTYDATGRKVPVRTE